MRTKAHFNEVYGKTVTGPIRPKSVIDFQKFETISEPVHAEGNSWPCHIFLLFIHLDLMKGS